MKLVRRGRQGQVPSLSTSSELSRIRNEINRIFETPFNLLASGASFFEGWEPTLDLYEDKDKITIRAELPGMKREDIEVSLHGSTLVLSGERRHEEENKERENYRSERYFGRFQRTITLPQPVDPNRIQANYRDGVLTITLPKPEEAKPRQIEVNAS